MRRFDPPPASTAAALLALALAAALAALAVAALAPPAPRPAAASPDVFSAARAMRHVGALAGRPRPVGSAAHEAARRYLLDELAELGLAAEVHEATVARTAGDTVVAARVRNVVARRPGRAAGPALLLLAHYDSRPQTPGAGDDASGVATILETLRALGDEPLERDVLVLFSDAEEAGLLGARAFAAGHPRAAEVAAVLNFESRGAAGPSIMFETGPGDGRVVRELARHARRPAASSLTVEVYRRMPNDTDFTVFRRRGVPGLNFAFIGDLPAYHSALDTPGRLSPASLQHHGENALAMVRALASLDPAAFAAPDAVYFDLLSRRLVVYPRSWAPGLAAATLAALALVLLLARRAGATAGQVGRGLLAFLAALALAAGGGWLAWRLLEGAAPGLLAGPYPAPWGQDGLALGVVLVAAAAAALLYGGAGSAAAPRAVATGTLIGWSVLGVVAAAVAPGASHLFHLPALAALAALAAAWRAGPRAAAWWALAGAVPGILMWAPVVVLLVDALTLAATAVVALVAALPLSLLAAPWAVAGRRPFLLAGVLAGGAVAITVAVALDHAPSAERPRTDSLLYALDADAGRAWWVSQDEAPDPWTSRVLGEAPEAGDYPEVLRARPGRTVLSSPGPALPLAPPRVELVGDEMDDAAGVRRLSVRLVPARGGEVLRLHADAPVRIEAVEVDGERVALPDPSAPVQLVHHAPPAGGVVVTLEMGDRQPLELALVEQSYGLPAVGGEGPGERPEWIIPTTSWWTDSTFVGVTAWH